jgi:hypothetical protein
MSWQDELRQLDAELADKQISSAEYRRRRDEILASASGGMPMNTSAPFPQRIAAPPQENTKPEVVPPWSPVTAIPRYQTPQYPVSPTMDDLFTVGNTKPKRSRTALVIPVICILVVLGLAAGWWFGFGSQARPDSSPASTTATSTAPRTVALKDLPPLPGTPGPQNGEFTVPEALNKGLLDARAAAFLTADHAVRLVFSSSKTSDLTYAVLAFNSDDPQQAAKITSDLTDYQKPNGLAPTDQLGLPGSVTVMKQVVPAQVQYLALYPSGRTTMVVAVTRTGGKGVESAVSDGLRNVMASVLAKVPVS